MSTEQQPSLSSVATAIPLTSLDDAPASQQQETQSYDSSSNSTRTLTNTDWIALEAAHRSDLWKTADIHAGDRIQAQAGLTSQKLLQPDSRYKKRARECTNSADGILIDFDMGDSVTIRLDDGSYCIVRDPGHDGWFNLTVKQRAAEPNFNVADAMNKFKTWAAAQEDEHEIKKARKRMRSTFAEYDSAMSELSIFSQTATARLEVLCAQLNDARIRMSDMFTDYCTIQDTVRKCRKIDDILHVPTVATLPLKPDQKLDGTDKAPATLRRLHMQ